MRKKLQEEKINSEKKLQEEKITIAKRLFSANVDLETIKISTGLSDIELVDIVSK